MNTNAVPMMDLIWTIVRKFHTRYSHLMYVAGAVVQTMRSTGHSARVIDYASGKYITVRVDDNDYKIIKDTGWHFYDVVQLK